jgi:predicted Zn-dependent protease
VRVSNPGTAVPARTLRTDSAAATRRLCLYVAPDNPWVFQAVQKAVAAAYEHLEVVAERTFEPGKVAYDTYRGLYDASYLLAQIPDQPEGVVSLLVVPMEICARGQLRVFGACADNKALVSSHLLGSMRAVANVATHEVGHLLGLSHCANACIMRPCRHLNQVEHRTEKLCRDCLREARRAPSKAG